MSKNTDTVTRAEFDAAIASLRAEMHAGRCLERVRVDERDAMAERMRLDAIAREAAIPKVPIPTWVEITVAPAASFKGQILTTPAVLDTTNGARATRGGEFSIERGGKQEFRAIDLIRMRQSDPVLDALIDNGDLLVRELSLAEATPHELYVREYLRRTGADARLQTQGVVPVAR